MKVAHIHRKLLDIADHYLVDLECLREMYSSVVPFLRERDSERQVIVSGILEKITALSDPLRTDEIYEECPRKPEGERKDARSISITSADGELLFSHLRKIRRAEGLFEKQSVVTLVSRFDEFLGKFLAIVLEMNPDWLKSSEKTITYRDLINLRSVDRLIEEVIQKEVENLLRGSHEEQISYIDEKLKIGLKEHFKKLPEFLEVCERRNLFVHTGGSISQQYLERCKAFGHKAKTEETQGQLGANEQYFLDAFNVFFELGLRVSQASYRRLFPSELEVADQALNKLAIKFLNSGDYSLAEVITNFDLSIPESLRSKDSEFLYFARVNRAFAQKYQNKSFEEGLKGVYWNAFHPKYTLCLHVLRDELEAAASMMTLAEIVKTVGLEGFRTWPVFRDFRTSTHFRAGYRLAFGEEYAPDPERDAKAISKQEEVISPTQEMLLEDSQTSESSQSCRTEVHSGVGD